MSSEKKGHAEALAELAEQRGVSVDLLVRKGHPNFKSRRWLTRLVWILAGSACALTIGGLYEISGAGNSSAYKLNRITGATTYCVNGECKPVLE